MIDEVQIVISDTPGLLMQKRNVVDTMSQNSVRRSLSESEAVIVLMDSIANRTSQKAIVKSAVNICSHLPSIIALSKQDLLSCGQDLEMFCKELNSEFLWVSSSNGTGLSSLKNWMVSKSNACEYWPYPEDQMSSSSDQFWACEVVREKLLSRLRQELPHSIIVGVESWEESDDEIDAKLIIYVERASHKGMIIGRSAKLVKTVGMEARNELAGAFGKKIHLFLIVKTKEKWRENESFIRDILQE